MNDTTRRFLNAIVDRIPDGGRIVELRLFPAIRQSGMESGVAVVAVEPAAAPYVEDRRDDDALSADAILADHADGDEPHDIASGDGTSAFGGDEVVAETDGGDDVADVDGGDDVADVDETDDVPDVDETDDLPDVDESDDIPDVDESDDIADIDHADDVPDVNAARSASGAESLYARVAHELVDTDAASDETEEEGASGGEVDATQSPVAHSEAVDDDVIGEALDEEMQRIVVHATRDVVAAEAVADESPVVEESPVADDSPYADSPAAAEATHRPIIAVLADGTTASDGGPPLDDVRLDDLLALPPAAGDALPDAPVADGRAPRESPPADAVRAIPQPILRFAILSARYRLTLKGPDRGKWEVEITHEADAPLATLERVARGVAKRAGDESDPEHFSAESLRQALDAPAWATTT